MINWLVICSLCFLYSLFVSVLKVNPIPNYVTYTAIFLENCFMFLTELVIIGNIKQITI